MAESKEVSKQVNPLKALDSQIKSATSVKELLKIDIVSNRYISNYEAGTGRKDGKEKYEREAFAFMELANTNAEIMKCDPVSIFAGFIKAGLTGLSFSSNRLSVYPRGGKLVVEPDAHGKREMLERMTTIRKIDEGTVVFNNDQFSFDPKNKKVVKHEQEFPLPKASEETVKAVYATVHFTDKHTEDYVMSLEELKIARSKSKMQEGGMLWKQHYGEACKKSVYNRIFKVLYQVPDTATIYKQFEVAEDVPYSDVSDEQKPEEKREDNFMTSEAPSEKFEDASIIPADDFEQAPKTTKKKRDVPDW
jgi:recombinational DNA repair protein RecT